MEKEKLSALSSQPSAPKAYELLVPWRAAAGAAEGLELDLGEGWLTIVSLISANPGARLRACSPRGQTLLEAMLAHGYVKEVAGE